MIIDPDILLGVNVPVFALSGAAPRRIAAWNAGMVTMTGLTAAGAMGRCPEEVLGVQAAVLQSVEGDASFRLDGIGAVAIRRQGDMLVCTVSDHERDMFIGLAAQDLRTPLRTIRRLAEDAARDGSSAAAVLERIRRVARQGITLTQDVVSCAQSGRGAAVAHRKVNLPTLAAALLAAAVPEEMHTLEVSPVTVLTERAVLQCCLRTLIGHALAQAGDRACALRIDVRTGEGGVEYAFHDENARSALPPHGFLDGASTEVEGEFGLLGVRRLLRSRGGGIALQRPGPDVAGGLVMCLPGCVLADKRRGSAA